MLPGEVVPNVGQHTADLVRLDGQHQNIGELATSGLEAVVFAPTSLANAARAASLGSLAMTWPAVTSPARTKPRARAVAILPAPRKPMVSFADMPGIVRM